MTRNGFISSWPALLQALESHFAAEHFLFPLPPPLMHAFYPCLLSYGFAFWSFTLSTKKPLSLPKSELHHLAPFLVNALHNYCSCISLYYIRCNHYHTFILNNINIGSRHRCLHLIGVYIELTVPPITSPTNTIYIYIYMYVYVYTTSPIQLLRILRKQTNMTTSGSCSTIVTFFLRFLIFIFVISICFVRLVTYYFYIICMVSIRFNGHHQIYCTIPCSKGQNSHSQPSYT